MKRIRGGSGLGDALYVRPIAEYFIRQGEKVTVCSDYADVFAGSGAIVEQFGRTNISVLAHYTQGKSDPSTTQWQDVCRSAGVTVPLQFDWAVKNQKLVDDLRAKAEGRPIMVVHGGRAPMGRTDGFGAELLPDRRAFDAVLSELRDCYLVRIGKGTQLYQLPVNIDLNGGTSVTDLLDVASICDGMAAQCSFAVPLAEVFDKPLLAIWSARGLCASHAYVKTITPQKILSKPTSRFVMDDWSDEKIQGAAHAFRQL